MICIKSLRIIRILQTKGFQVGYTPDRPFRLSFKSALGFMLTNFKVETVNKKRKKVPDRWLTPRTIFYWYMDDGAEK